MIFGLKHYQRQLFNFSLSLSLSLSLSQNIDIYIIYLILTSDFSGFVYGAKENKKLKVFIDDVNLPVPDYYGVQKCNEVRPRKKYCVSIHSLEI